MRRVAVSALALLFAFLCGCGQTTQSGAIHAAVTVVHEDQSTKEFSFDTDCTTLGAALLEQEIASGEQGPYGLYIMTADGETADESREQWWCITKGGAAVQTGADDTPLADGDTFELTLTTGY